MLLNLHVKNLALIRETEVDFKDGLNILSGETGAGKSIIIGSVNLALGEKISKSMLREDAEYALVELVFQVTKPQQLQALKELEIHPEQGEVIMSRKIMSNGRSVCRINSETVSAALMRKVASILIDIHGQHEHQSLLTKKNHMKYLDSYGKKELTPALEKVDTLYKEYTEIKKELDQTGLDAEQQARELSFLQYEIQEIEEANLQPGEDDDLEQDFRRFSNGRKIMEAASECRELCGDGMNNAADQISRGARALIGVASFDEPLQGLSQQIQELESLLNDFNRDLADYMSDVDFSDETFREIQERLDLINHLKSKYGKTIPQILEAKADKEAQVDKLMHYDAYRRDLEMKLQAVEDKLKQSCSDTTKLRKAYGAKLAQETKQALQDLNFLDVQFEMEFSKLDHYTANGWDEARFMISTNPGEPMKPLDAVASGGELSRIMLALKTVLAENDEIETLIFDEIDSGISGRTAQMVAEKIRETGKNHQIICITHLPQIAAMANEHFLIEKTSDRASTISNIRSLEREESIQELARMLGGVRITDTVMQSAREMKELAEHL